MKFHRQQTIKFDVTRFVTRLLIFLGAFALASAPVGAQEKPKDLSSVSLEDLMNIQVTSVSKKEQKLSEVPAAIFVITPEDIARSGATNIPDLLRMVPGLDVAQVNANTWAISARGFNSQFADKLLVLFDGRAIYTPLLGGVFWDTQDVPLEDVARIEVIRGPGGTVWGANAVNGVINIITKKAGDTPGALVAAGGGTQAQEFGTVQYGGKINENTNYRVFTKCLNNGHFPDLNGQNGDDDWHLLHGGFRVDTLLSKRDSVTFQGDLYTGSEGATIVHSILFPPNNVIVETITGLSGGNILGRWDHNFSNRSDTSLQLYFDRYTRSGPESKESRNTLDLDFQHHLVLGRRQDLIWGLGFRFTTDRTVGTIDQSFVPADFSGNLFSAFVQDQIVMKPDRLSVYIGTKLENNYYSGFDLDPSVRVAWTPTALHTFWAAVSRASKIPTQRQVSLNAVLAALPGPAEVVLLGNPNLKSQPVIAYELGYRAQPANWLSIDIAAFFNNYQHLQSIEPLPPYLDANSILPITVNPKLISNKIYGTTEGIEASVNWKITHRWSLSPGYSFLEMHLHAAPSSLDTSTALTTEGSSPTHQAQLRSRVELSRLFSWDLNAYFAGRLPAQGVASYTRLDTQLTWRFAERASLSLVGQNLMADHHVESNDGLSVVNSSQVKRSAYAKIAWHF